MKRHFVIERDSDLRAVFANVFKFAKGMFAEFGSLVVTLSEKARTNPQNDHFHGQIQDIYKQCKAAGSKRSFERWKRLLAEQFIYENPDLNWEEVGVVPSLDGKRIVQMHVQTSKFSVLQSTAFIEWLYAYGSELGIVFLVDRRIAEKITA